MQINTNQIITMTEANRNFSKAVRIAEKNGNAIIFKNNMPSYMIIDLKQPGIYDLTDDEKIDVVAKRILDKYKEAFKRLAE